MLRISYGENSSCFKSKKPGQNLTAERSELQILGFRDLEITNFRSLDIRAICLICVNLPMLAMQIQTTNFSTKKTSFQNQVC